MAPLDAVGPGVRKKQTRPAKGQGAHRYVCVLPVCCALVALCPRWKTSDRKVYTNVGSIRRHTKSALRARYIGREMADAKASGVRGAVKATAVRLAAVCPPLVRCLRCGVPGHPHCAGQQAVQAPGVQVPRELPEGQGAIRRFAIWGPGPWAAPPAMQSRSGRGMTASLLSPWGPTYLEVHRGVPALFGAPPGVPVRCAGPPRAATQVLSHKDYRNLPTIQQRPVLERQLLAKGIVCGVPSVSTLWRYKDRCCMAGAVCTAAGPGAAAMTCAPWAAGGPKRSGSAPSPS